MTKVYKRTIENVLDLKTGDIIESDPFFFRADEDIFKLRHKLEIDIQNNQKRFVCLFCKQNVKIRGQIGAKKIMHFAHIKDSDDCPIKTNNNFTKEEIERIKYNGAKESDLHIDLKNKIAYYLTQNEKSELGIKNVQIEVVHKDKRIPSTWKKPDISTEYYKKKLVIELQLSTTFLSVIIGRQEFYKRNNTYILWIFHYFENNIDKRKFTQSDIFYSNNQNGFEFNKNAQKLSNEKNELILCCHFAKPEINNDEIIYVWKKEYVTLAQLTFNITTYQVYYFDVSSEKAELEKELKLRDSEFLQIISNGDVKSLLVRFKYYNLSEAEKNRIEKLYKEEVHPLKHIEYNSKEIRIIWAIIAQKLKEKLLLNEIVIDFTLQEVIIDILSLKLNKIIGYDFQRQIQIAHNLLSRHPEFLEYYQKAIIKYNNIGYDKDGKLKKKMKNINLNGIEQIINNKIIETIFPELKK